jgi:hypothetical protein
VLFFYGGLTFDRGHCSLYGVTFVFKFKFLLQKMILLFIILL